jgi:exodeoxyribonuclease III
MEKWISWNVNGLRAAMKKGFMDFLQAEAPDVMALQETKMKPEQADFAFDGYHSYWNSADKAGYAGTLVLSRKEPKSVILGIDGDGYNDEGRIITLEFDQIYFVNAYVPNAQPELRRLDYRMKYEDHLREYLVALDARKPVVYTGDLNVAHEEIDLKNPKANERNPGFSIEERGKLDELLAAGFTDTFRALYPDTVAYSWWSYRAGARKRNAGWRIDYFLVSDRLMPQVSDSQILGEVLGSDHCPVKLLTAALD